MATPVPMTHPWKGERAVHPKAVRKYERNGWSVKPPPKPDPPRRRRSQPTPTEAPQAPEMDSGAVASDEHEEQE